MNWRCFFGTFMRMGTYKKACLFLIKIHEIVCFHRWKIFLNVIVNKIACSCACGCGARKIYPMRISNGVIPVRYSPEKPVICVSGKYLSKKFYRPKAECFINTSSVGYIVGRSKIEKPQKVKIKIAVRGVSIINRFKV